MKIKNKILINSTLAITACAAIAAPLCSISNNVVIANNNTTNKTKLASNLTAQYATVKFTKGTYTDKCTITGSTLVKTKVGVPFCSVTQPKILHNDSWKFLGWSVDGQHEIDKNTVVPKEGLTLTPLFEEPIDITNCMGISAIEQTTVTFHLQSENTPDLQYSTDYGKNWVTVTKSDTNADPTYTMLAGTTIYLKGKNDGTKEGKTFKGFSTSSTNYTHFSFSNHVNIFGNVLSLIYDGSKVTKLSKVPNNYCFYHLFEGCTNIMNISDNFLMSEGNEDPGTEEKPKEVVTDCLTANCYEGMFTGCTNISHAPRLYATNANVKNGQGCYKEIFKGCSKINYVRTRFTGDFTDSNYSACWQDWALGVASAGKIVYDGSTTTHSSSAIPEGWTKTATPDTVQITTTQTSFMADHEYKLSAKCLKGSTELPDEGVVWLSDNTDACVVDQASGVLRGIPFAPTSEVKTKTANITAYCKANLNASASITVTIKPFDQDALNNCTKITATEAAKFKWTYVGEGLGDKRTIPTFKYSTDGINWKEMVKEKDIDIAANSYIYIKGDNPSGLARGDDETSYTNFVTTSGKVKVEGDIKGLIYDGLGSDEITDPKIPCDYCFKSLFENSNVTSVSSGFLSFTNFNGKTNVYHSMFEECGELTSAPNLPATVLSNYCYFRMFFNCSKLANAPTLSGSTLAHSCYKRMFYGCSTMTSTPALPVTAAQPYCYYMMFQGCKGLTSINKISLTSLADYACFQMFAETDLTFHYGSASNYFFHCPSKTGVTNSVTRMLNGYEPSDGEYIRL